MSKIRTCPDCGKKMTAEETIKHLEKKVERLEIELAVERARAVPVWPVPLQPLQPIYPIYEEEKPCNPFPLNPIYMDNDRTYTMWQDDENCKRLV